MTTLSRTQQELLDAMKAGVEVRLQSDGQLQFWRRDTYQNCTAAANALVKKKLARVTTKLGASRTETVLVLVETQPEKAIERALVEAD